MNSHKNKVKQGRNKREILEYVSLFFMMCVHHVPVLVNDHNTDATRKSSVCDCQQF